MTRESEFIFITSKLCLGSGLHSKGFSFPVNFFIKKIGYFGSQKKRKRIYKLHDLYNVLNLDGDLEDMDRLVGQVKLISSNWKGKCTIKKK
jgi:hypothetical protein